MGEVFEPEDFLKGRKGIIDKAVRDLSPGVREATRRIIGSWKGEESKRELIKLLGGRKG